MEAENHNHKYFSLNTFSLNSKICYKINIKIQPQLRIISKHNQKGKNVYEADSGRKR